MKKMIYGSSLHMRSGMRQVWVYDESLDQIIPVASYSDPNKARTAAFELTHAVLKGEDESSIDKILSNRDGNPIEFLPKESGVIKILIDDAAKESEARPLSEGNFSTRTTGYDDIFVARFQ